MKKVSAIKLNENQARQGDVFLRYVDKPEAEPKTVEPGQIVILAHGEVTGHTHAMRVDTPATVPPSKPIFDAAAERYIQMLDSGALSHEEHSMYRAKAGVIEIGVQVEAGPHNMLRRVAD
jgi:hypothetical protein